MVCFYDCVTTDLNVIYKNMIFKIPSKTNKFNIRKANYIKKQIDQQISPKMH